jgi:hypothetical protein
MAYGPQLDGSVTYDHSGRLQNWLFEPGFTVSLPRLTNLTLSLEDAYELFNGQEFRETSAAFALTTSWFKWLDMSASYSLGTQPNYERDTASSVAFAAG